jgi:hypothetical protein
MKVNNYPHNVKVRKLTLMMQKTYLFYEQCSLDECLSGILYLLRQNSYIYTTVYCGTEFNPLI